MLDSDLAKLYEVKTKVLNQAVKRNLHRFPEDFMFRLSNQELNSLRSQFVTLKRKLGCADILKSYPDEETAFIGLLLLSEKFQGKGFWKKS